MAIALLVILAGIGMEAALWSLSPTQAPSRSFTVLPGEDLQIVTHHLQEAGLVRSAWVAYAIGRLLGAQRELQAGRYRLAGDLGTMGILDALVHHAVDTGRVTIPEGFTVQQIDALLASRGICPPDAFTQAVRSPDPYLDHFPWLARLPAGASLEGFLFPDTYSAPGPMPPQELVRMMLQDFQLRAIPLLNGPDHSHLGFFRSIVLASIVEKEAKVPQERPLIAGVFLNRLRLGIPLGSDPTVEYALGHRQGPRGLSLHDIAIDSPYNTYRFRGLPPGPIDNPGASCIRAVLKGESTPYLYFVARGDGTHQFSQTYSQQIQAQRKYQLGMKTP